MTIIKSTRLCIHISYDSYRDRRSWGTHWPNRWALGQGLVRLRRRAGAAVCLPLAVHVATIFFISCTTMTLAFITGVSCPSLIIQSVGGRWEKVLDQNVLPGSSEIMGGLSHIEVSRRKRGPSCGGGCPLGWIATLLLRMRINTLPGCICNTPYCHSQNEKTFKIV